MPRNQTLRIDILHNFVPLNALSQKRRNDVLNGCHIESRPAGNVLFRYGDCDGQCIFLLSGEVELTDHSGEKTLISAMDVAANHAIGQTQPRQYTATAVTPVNVLSVDQERLYNALLWEQSLSGLAQSLFQQLPPDTDRDWVLRLLQSRIFYRVPPMNILELLKSLMPVPVQRGERVIRQGDSADCCYFIHAGRAEVIRHEGEDSVVVAYLGKGQYFGEEGLLQDAPRNADVVMLEDGLLMRLDKAGFDRLLKAPSLDTISFAMALSLVQQDEADWLDVRLPEEFRQGHLRGAVNLPLQDIRRKAQNLPLNRHYIIYSYNAQRSAAAAFMMGVQGFHTSILTGGLLSLDPGQRRRYLDTE